jgi:hypothetical protein
MKDYHQRFEETVILFTRMRIQNPCPVLLFGEPIVWVDVARYLGGDPW